MVRKKGPRAKAKPQAKHPKSKLALKGRTPSSITCNGFSTNGKAKQAKTHIPAAPIQDSSAAEIVDKLPPQPSAVRRQPLSAALPI
jgi:hypothetical protein